MARSRERVYHSFPRGARGGSGRKEGKHRKGLAGRAERKVVAD